jgi:iron(III) transport system permease protein
MKGNFPYSRWPLFLVVLLWLLPFPFLVAEATAGSGRGFMWWVQQRGWQIAARHSLEQVVMVMGLGVGIGWLPGVLLGLVSSGWRWVIQVLCALPLVVPPFLWAIGWSFLSSVTPRAWYAAFDGRWGMLFAGLASAVPLVILSVSLLIRKTPRAQWEFLALRLERRRILWIAAKRAFPTAIGAAALAALLGSADAGAGQIMGWHGLSGEVLVSLATKQNIGEAAAKASVGLLLLLPFCLLGTWLLQRAWQQGPSGRGLVRAGGLPHEMHPPWWQAGLLFLMVLAILALPMGGLVAPLFKAAGNRSFYEALMLWGSSAKSTVCYAVVGGGVATLGGAVLASHAVKHPRWIGVCLLGATVPFVFRSLGWVAAGAEIEPVRRILSTESGVACVLGAQWFPVAGLLLTPAFAALPNSWRDRHRLMGTSGWIWVKRVLTPWLAPALVMTVLCIGLLILADVTSLMLLAPPGRTAFSSHVFAVMDNSTEVVVASPWDRAAIDALGVRADRHDFRSHDNSYFPHL